MSAPEPRPVPAVNGCALGCLVAVAILVLLAVLLSLGWVSVS